MSFALSSRRAALAPGAWVRNDLWRRARAVPSLDLRFAESKSLVDATTGQSLVTFTRASSGTYVGSDGLIKTATTNEPRFDHNPTTGESLGLLVEEARTNLILQSNGFDTTWINSNSSETATSGTAPDGTNTAWEMRDTADGSAVAHALQQTISFTSGTAYTFTVFAKQGTQPNCALLFPSGAFGTANARFNLSAGTIANSTGVTATITALASNWYRCAITATASSTASGAVIVRTDNGSTSVYQGNGTGTVLLWGAQLEAGAFPTSYIPTTTATVTRSADVASITGTNFSSWYRQDEGTVFADSQRPFTVTSGFQRIFSINDGSGNNETNILWGSASSKFYSAIISGGAASADIGFFSQTQTISQRGVVGYKVDSFGFTANGQVPATDTLGPVPVSVNRLEVGQFSSAGHINGTIRRLAYWPQRLSNSTLQALTQ